MERVRLIFVKYYDCRCALFRFVISLFPFVSPGQISKGMGMVGKQLSDESNIKNDSHH